MTGPCGDFVAPRLNVLNPTPGFMFGDRDRLYIRATSPDADVKRITFAYKDARGRVQNLSHFHNPDGSPLDFAREVPSFR